mgnify:CR=1 FL=1
MPRTCTVSCPHPVMSGSNAGSDPFDTQTKTHNSHKQKLASPQVLGQTLSFYSAATALESVFSGEGGSSPPPSPPAGGPD